MTSTTSVQSIQRVFALLEALSSRPDGESLNRLAAETGLSKSTAHRLLGNLVHLGYAMQDRDSKKFSLTVKLFEVGSRVVQHMNVLSIAKPFMFDLSRTLGEIVNLGIRAQNDVLYVYIEESGENAVRVAAHVGARNPLHCTAVGKAMLAELSDEEIDRIWRASDIKQYTPTTITDFSELMRTIAQVRRDGYAFDQEEYEPGIWCVASCIVNYSGVPQGALSATAPMSRLDEEHKQRMIREVTSTVRKISAGFGKTEWEKSRP